MIKAAVLGYGNIGSGVVQILLRNKEVIAKHAGDEIVPVCVLDLRDFPGDVMEDKVVRDINLITCDPEIKIVVETMGGTKPAYAFVKACLEAGKHVITSNKELVAAHGPELLTIANEKKVQFLFEASVAGGIPIIRPLTTCMTADGVTEITGILNGTTNYMLSKMSNEGLEYDAVLEDAQERGYAERNPAADVEGYDACRKIAILSSLAFGQYMDYQDVHTEGITKITAADIVYAKEMGKKIKLFGSCKKDAAGEIHAMVCPVMIGAEHPLFAVEDVMNAVLVRGECMGDLMFYGAGAGKLPTASAVVADVICAAKNHPASEIPVYAPGKIAVADYKESVNRYFVRVKLDQTDAEAVQKAFHGENVLQLMEDELGMLTGSWKEKEFDAVCEQYSVLNVIRLAE